MNSSNVKIYIFLIFAILALCASAGDDDSEFDGDIIYDIEQEPGAVVCTDPESGKKYKPGKSWKSSKKCKHYTCVKLEDGLVVEAMGCGYFVPPDCTVKPGKGEYPKCCPQIVCPDDEE